MDPSIKFEKANEYLEYPLKQMAIEFLLTLPNKTGAQLFAKDKINAKSPGAQTFIVAHAKRIYRRSVCAAIDGQPASYYEWMGGNMKISDETVKNTIDLDMEGVPQSRPFNNDIVWVVQFVNAAIEARYKIVVHNNQWIVLKCHYDSVKQKYSAHLILHGYMWGTVAARKAFMESIGLVQEFAKRCPEAASPEKVVDAGVFGAKMLRLVKSTKLGKNLPLWPAKLKGFMEPEDNFDFFQKSLGSYTIGCQLLEEPLSVALPIVAPPKKSQPGRGASSSAIDFGAASSSNDRYAPLVEDLRRVVMALDKQKRAAKHTRDLWIRLGWAIVNTGRTGSYEQEAIEVFREFSMTCIDAYDEAAFNKVVQEARDHSDRLGWTYLKTCFVEDTEVFLDSMSIEDVAESSSSASRAADETRSSDEARPIDGPVAADSVLRTYASVKKDFEVEFFKLKHPVRVVQVTPEETYYMRLAEVRENEGLLTYDEVVEEKGVKKVAEKRFFEKWWNDKYRRTFDKVDFLPPPLFCPRNIYNLFKGFRAESLPQIDEDVCLEPMFNLMRRLTNEMDKPPDSQVGFNYLLDWLAHIIQIPGHLPRTAILIQSPQGAGKNVFSSFIGEQILGESLYLSSAKIDTFFDKFANGLSEKLLCNFNEVALALTKCKQDEIKEAITEKKVALEKKGVDRIFVRNCARHIWFSNRIMPIVIEDTDRRWVALQADKEIPDAAYFTALVAWAEDDRNARAFYNFLKARDISDWNALRDRPRTEYYTELQQMSLSTIDQWLIHMVEEQTLPVNPMAASDLLFKYNFWLGKFAPDLRPIQSKNFLRPQLRSYFGHGIHFDTSPGRPAYYSFDQATLLDTLVKAHKIAAPPSFLPDD